MLEDVFLPIVGILSVFVFCPLAIAYSIKILRSPTEPRAPRVPDDIVRRMADLQASMDSMALEIERISEGQRFVTKLMSERPAGELSAPARVSKAPASKRGT